MRIAVSADNNNGLISVVAPHFGRCPFFVLVDVSEGGTVEAVKTVDNPFYTSHQPGQVPQFINSLGADVMLSGGMGARAVEFFEQFGIKPVTGAMGTVQQSVEQFLGGKLDGVEACAGHDHDAETPAEGGCEHDAVGRLHEEAEALEQQLDEVQRRLSSLK